MSHDPNPSPSPNPGASASRTAPPRRPDAPDTIDAAAGLSHGDALHTARRFRQTVVDATQASHDALLFDPVAGLSPTDRLRVAVRACETAGAGTLASLYRRLLDMPARAAETPGPARAAMLEWATTLTRDPRRGDRDALQALKTAGLGDAAIVALAQLVAFLSYQTRVVAGLRAMAAPADGPDPAAAAPVDATSGAPPVSPASAAAPGPIRINGFTDETLGWRSWLVPVRLDEATALQQAVLDESHAQARSSDYYLTLVHQPLMLRHRSAAYNAIMYAPGGLPRAERELGALVVSVTNGCVYCTSVHAQRYAQLARRRDTVAQAFTDPATAGSTPREQAVARFARAVTLRPQSLGATDLAPLRAQGLGDTELIDLLHAVAIFGWANRLMHNLGEPVLPAA